MRQTTHSGDARYQAAKKKKFIMLGILLGVLGLIWGRIALQSSPPPRPAKGKRVSVKNTSNRNEPAPIRSSDATDRPVIEIGWPAVLTRDLFRYEGMATTRNEPVVAQGIDVRAEATLRSLQLQGTVLGEDSRALINGQTMREGESINGVLIKKIEQHHVVVEINGVEVKLHL